VSQARTKLRLATTQLAEADAALATTAGEIQRTADLGALVSAGRSEQVAGAARSKDQLRQRAVSAFIRGDQRVNLIGVIDNPADYSRATHYLRTVAGLDRDAMQEYQAGIATMNAKELELVDAQAQLNRQIIDRQADRRRATQVVLDAQRCLTAYETGSHMCADGFVFPVSGMVNFIDSWGFPRLAGGPDQHWHEGTDVMAPFGREIVAVENGTLFKVGTAGLGGLRLWLRGDSGTDYYYAHFRSIDPEMVDGLAVTAGTVLGGVGNSGDASGGPAHLHFQIHPGGADPVNPFFMLKAAYGARPMPLEAVALAGPPSALASVLPPEEQTAPA